MHNQIALLRESLVTMFALERALSGVCSYMSSQTVLPRESLVTIFTLEGSLSTGERPFGV